MERPAGRNVVRLFAETWLEDVDGFAFVLQKKATGVFWVNQCGGNQCLQRCEEGYVVPAWIGYVRPVLDRLFLGEFQGGGVAGLELTEAQISALREAVEMIQYIPRFDPTVDVLLDESQRLRLDEERLDEIDEAWVPVITADGPGVLVWENSD